MQSPAPPPGSFSFSQVLKQPGYYLWLAAIGAIVYAYVFANRPLDAENKDVVSENDNRQSITNTGNRVLLLLPLVWLYTYVIQLFTRFTGYDYPLLKFGLPIIMFLLSIRAVVGLGSATTYYWSYSLFVYLIPIAAAIIAKFAANDAIEAAISWTGFATKFIFILVFPAMMMQYFIQTGVTGWFQIVSGVSIGISSLMLLYNWYAIYNQIVPMKPIRDTVLEPWKTLLATSPLLTYLKYIFLNDLTDVAKRVLIFALLCYVAYLMISVYKFKHQLVPCASTTFASCFGSPATWTSTTTPYVNTLFYAMGMSVLVNVINFFMKLFLSPLYPLLASFMGETNMAANAIPSWTSRFSLVTLFQMLLFPFYWPVQQFMQRPIAVIVAFVAFAVLGLLLYRSSFDLTAFIEGQRGTVIAVFTIFVASLIGFGVYTSTSSSAGTSTSNSGTNTSNSEEGMSYGQFIFRPVLILAVVACVVGLLLYFLTSSSRLSQMANLLQYAITALIYIGGIAVIIGLVRTVFSTSRKMGDSMFQISPDDNWVTNVVKLVGNALFYLPCLMIDSVEMLKEQYGLTTRPILILLALQAAFILAGHVLPSLVTRAINHTGVQILSAPVSMTTQTTISRYRIKFVNTNGVASDDSGTSPLPPSLTPAPTTTTISPSEVQLYNYRYGVSAWFYIHPQPPSSYKPGGDVAMFAFGGDLGPTVTYNSTTNALTVIIAGADTPIPSITDVPLQRWNNLVINSDKGAIDIFVNGALIYTGLHIPQIPTSPAVSSVTIGDKPIGDDEDKGKLNQGANGEICNMVLNREPFTKAEIAWFYNTNKVMNPPVVGVNPDPLNQGDSASDLASQAAGTIVPTESNVDTTNPMSFSKSGSATYGWLGAVFGAIFGWIFNNADTMAAIKGVVMGAVVFGLIGALLGGLFSTDGTVANIMKTVANVFVDTF
jgi:hypothetical protein